MTDTAIIAIAIRDAVYLQDFSVKEIDLDGEDKHEEIVTDYIISNLSSYERNIFSKFIGAGLPTEIVRIAPKLSSRLWSELDIVPIYQRPEQENHHHRGKRHWAIKCVDEQADSMARRCIM